MKSKWQTEEDLRTDEHYLISREQLKQIVKLTIEEAHSSWSWDEGMDIPVLWLRIDRDVLAGTQIRRIT